MKRYIPVTAILMALAGVAGAEVVAPGAVTFTETGAVEASLTGVAGDPVNGQAIMVNRGKGNCLACHAVTALESEPFHGNVGPTLDGAADRWEEADLRGMVANAKMTFEGSAMPSFYRVDGFIRVGDAYTGKAATEVTPLLTAQEVEDVVAYLLTLSDE